MRIVFLLIIISGYCCLAPCAAETGVALESTPVLNTPDFKAVFGGSNGLSLRTDRCGQVRELEFIAVPGSVFTILSKQHAGAADIYEVETDEYVAPPNVKLYIDSRFIRLVRTPPAPRITPLLPREMIVSALRKTVGTPYVWGGNVPEGVPGLAKWFFRGFGEDDRGRLTLAGLDCSGLLYYATGGWTPRNTSQLTAFGRGVPIRGRSTAEIAALLQPLDLIVWNGHVIIVLDQLSAIESRLECSKPGHGGVVITQLSQRLAEIMRTRTPANAWPNSRKRDNIFIVRRWHD